MQDEKLPSRRGTLVTERLGGDAGTTAVLSGSPGGSTLNQPSGDAPPPSSAVSEVAAGLQPDRNSIDTSMWDEVPNRGRES